MNPDLDLLHPYPFEKLRKLFSDVTPNPELDHITLGIGEPKHAAPQFVLDTLTNNLNRIGQYPSTAGLPELREAISEWLCRRFKLGNISIDNILPVNGTREALFAIAQAAVDRQQAGYVMFPNPFYQIYEGACLLAGAEPLMVNCDTHTGLPDFSEITEAQWEKTQLLYLCTPGNPTGAVVPERTLQWLIEKAQRHNFILASDECYSEIYYHENIPPVGLLEAAWNMGNTDFKNCLVFHSLSKRSNLPGLRSGFVAGDQTVIKNFLRYRTYHGCSMSVPVQLASIEAWADEAHVKHNRDQYRIKFDTFKEVLQGSLDINIPAASFYLWPHLPVSGEMFAKKLYEEQNMTVLPSAYLSRENAGITPGHDRVRLALVSTVEECREAAERIKTVIDSLG